MLEGYFFFFFLSRRNLLWFLWSCGIIASDDHAKDGQPLEG